MQWKLCFAQRLNRLGGGYISQLYRSIVPTLAIDRARPNAAVH